jgi:hypothetical protein
MTSLHGVPESRKPGEACTNTSTVAICHAPPVGFERALMKLVQGHAIDSIGVVTLAEYNQFRSRFRTMYRTKPLIS